jgi:hypothetical protein
MHLRNSALFCMFKIKGIFLKKLAGCVVYSTETGLKSAESEIQKTWQNKWFTLSFTKRMAVGIDFKCNWEEHFFDDSLWSFIFLFFSIIVLGVYCDIYKSSYNISELNSPPPPFSLSSLHSWNSFNRSHFSIYIHVYRILLPHAPFYTLSLYPPSSYWYQSPRQDLFCLPALCFCWKKKGWHYCLFKTAIQGVSLWHSMYICITIQKNWFIPSIFLLSP